MTDFNAALTDRKPLSGPSPLPEIEPAPGDVAPFGAIGADADRGPDGRFVAGNRAALVVGQHSAAFWAEQAQARQRTRLEVLADAGHTETDAPAALRLAAEGIAQAALLRDSAFARLVESGGPLTSRGRARRAYTVWLTATDRLERHLRLVGLRRMPRPVPSARDILAEYNAQAARVKESQ